MPRGLNGGDTGTGPLIHSDTKRPLFSIITIAKNAEGVIQRTLQSVAGQTFADFEYIVIDGASTDDTVAIVREYHVPYMTVVSEKDRGIANAMNKGILLSSGKVIIHMNAGDAFASPDILQRVATDYQQYGWEWAIGSYEAVDPRRGIIREQWVRAFDYSILRRTQVFSHQSTFVARTVFERFGPFNETFRVAMDHDFWLRIGRSVTPRILPFMVARVLLGGVSSNPLRVNFEVRRARMKNLGRSSGVLFEGTEFLLQLALCMADKFGSVPAYRAMKRSRIYVSVRDAVLRRHYPNRASVVTTTIRKCG